ncbi:MAG: helix-turn-helix domain-containing protein [Lachnospiraceae bacterium]|nr:helix-turn-helix domain-containing protein [Lachnospiraceae bacterium]
MNNIKQLRNHKGITQQELAEAIHVTQQTIYKYENELVTPSMVVLQDMCDYFKVSMDDLIGTIDAENIFSKTVRSFNASLSKDEYILVAQYRKMSPSQKKTFKRMFDNIYNSYSGYID